MRLIMLGKDSLLLGLIRSARISLRYQNSAYCFQVGVGKIAMPPKTTLTVFTIEKANPVAKIRSMKINKHRFNPSISSEPAAELPRKVGRVNDALRV